MGLPELPEESQHMCRWHSSREGFDGMCDECEPLWLDFITIATKVLAFHKQIHDQSNVSIVFLTAQQMMDYYYQTLHLPIAAGRKEGARKRIVASFWIWKHIKPPLVTSSDDLKHTWTKASYISDTNLLGI